MEIVCVICGNDYNVCGKSYQRKLSTKKDYYCLSCKSKLRPRIIGNELGVQRCEPVWPILPPQSETIYGPVLNDTKWDISNGGKCYTEIFGEDKRVLVLGDLHCGHKSGLTPPDWWVNPANIKRYEIQKECWEFFSSTVKDVGHVDALVINGDCIDGKGKRSGGSELITSDLFKQVKIAKECIREIDFDNLYITYGTPYHTGDEGDDFELTIAEEFNGIIKDHLWLDVNGCVFDFKHKIGGSSVLSSRVGSLIKEYQWNSEWAKINGAPRAECFVRSHVHYCCTVTDHTSFFATTLPALQAPDTKYGGRQCSGTVDYGLTLFEVPKDYKNIDDVKFTVFKKQLQSTRSEGIIV